MGNVLIYANNLCVQAIIVFHHLIHWVVAAIQISNGQLYRIAVLKAPF